jgi:hypothetical protein
MSDARDWLVPRADGFDVWTWTEMPDWSVRKHRRLAIVIDGRRCYVTKVHRVGARWCYSLVDWPASLTDLPGGEVVYDGELAEERDARALADRRGRALGWTAWLLAPIVGASWRATKRHVHERHGIEPRTATRASIAVEACLALFVASFLMIFAFFGGMLFWPWTLFFGVDVLARAGSLLSDESPGLGFCEWPVAAVRWLRVTRRKLRDLDSHPS